MLPISPDEIMLRTGLSEVEAIQKAESQILAVSVSSLVGPTLTEYANLMYLPTVKDRSAKWTEQIAWALDGHIYPSLGKMQITEIKRETIQRFLDLKSRSLAPASLGHLRKILFAIFRLAEADEVVTRNPVALIRIVQRRREIVAPYTAAECKKLLDAAKGASCYNALYMAVTLGLREGECLGVKWTDISENKLRVRRQHGSEPLKTSSSRRDIPLPVGWLEGLDRRDKVWVSPLRDYRSVVGRTSGVYKGKFRNGKPVKPCGFKGAAEIAGLPEKNFHSLRKSLATMLEEGLCPQGLIGAILGHTSGSVTRIYIHDSETVMRAALQTVFDRIMATPNEQASTA